MTDPFTDEDRALLDCWVEDKMLAGEQMIPEERAALRAALAHIDHLEKALEAADELLFEIDGTCLCLGPGHVCGICKARNAYRSAREALKGEDDG